MSNATTATARLDTYHDTNANHSEPARHRADEPGSAIRAADLVPYLAAVAWVFGEILTREFFIKRGLIKPTSREAVRRLIPRTRPPARGDLPRSEVAATPPQPRQGDQLQNSGSGTNVAL